MWRTNLAHNFTSMAAPLVLPQPVVVYASRGHGNVDNRHRSRLMIWEAARVEPLIAITEEDARREGFESVTEFRRHWKARYRTFDALLKVAVLEVRPLREGDIEHFAMQAFEHLWGRYEPSFETVTAA